MEVGHDNFDEVEEGREFEVVAMRRRLAKLSIWMPGSPSPSASTRRNAFVPGRAR